MCSYCISKKFCYNEEKGEYLHLRGDKNMGEWVTVVSNLGFPIAACAAMFWQMNKMSEQHKEETNKMVEAINNNTIALTKLTTEREGRSGN